MYEQPRHLFTALAVAIAWSSASPALESSTPALESCGRLDGHAAFRDGELAYRGDVARPCIFAVNAGSRTEVPADVREPERWTRVAPNILHWTFGGPKEESAKEAGDEESRPSATEAPDAERHSARAFIVFFELGKADLTEEGRRIVRRVAAHAKETGAPSIVITTFGRAPSGPASVNVGLSAPRADSVKAELVRRGIPAQAIDIAWGVEPQPLADLPYGPREPLNNRVEITVGGTEPET